MQLFFIKSVKIQKVRHLKDLCIHIASDEEGLRHLILTGKNGSGKTSLLESIRNYLNSVSTTNDPSDAIKYYQQAMRNLEYAKQRNSSRSEIVEKEKKVDFYKERVEKSKSGLDIDFSLEKDEIKAAFEHGDFVLAYFEAKRTFNSPEPKHVEKTLLKGNYGIKENTNSKFLSYLLDLKMTEALAIAKKDYEKAGEIDRWFNRLQEILRDIYDDETLQIAFDEDNFKFSLSVRDHEPFDFNTASDGFSAILDIIVELIMRMQRQDKRITEFLVPGIVLIDEIENHLHLELQKRVLRILTELFPNIQFIVTTHSPFILNSISNATVYDLESQTESRNLAEASYSGIVEGYFNQDELSADLREKLNEYRTLTRKPKLTDEDYMKIALLETSLDEIPDYIEVAISMEYRKMKLEFEAREAQE